MAGILKEGQAVTAEDPDETTMDACLIAAAQRVDELRAGVGLRRA